jgi:hypothetical protein
MQTGAQLREELHSRFDIPVGIRATNKPTSLPTGIRAVDELLAGGIPQGSLTEIVGAVSTARTALAFSLLTQATRSGYCCAWIDATGTFDPLSAAETGVDLTRVLWVDCGGSTEHALKCVDLLIHAGGFGLIVIDLADTPDREARRISLASWFRLRHAAERTGAALVAIAHRFNARPCSAVQIEMRRKRRLWTGNLFRGFELEAESRKHFHPVQAQFRAVR